VPERGFSDMGRPVKVWQLLLVLIALIWVGNTPRKRAIIATCILLLIAVGIGPA
jgi:type II secretory pathway component PulM